MPTILTAVTESFQWVAAGTRRGWAWLKPRLDQKGEGVVSTAIAVLVMAFIGAGMYVAFNATVGKAQKKTDCQVDTIGAGAATTGPGC